jgi:hypothetical protein
MITQHDTKHIGQKRPFRLEDIWRIRIRLEVEHNVINLALLNLALDSKLRSCDLLSMKVFDISCAGVIQSRLCRTQSKTGREVQFEISVKHSKA